MAIFESKSPVVSHDDVFCFFLFDEVLSMQNDKVLDIQKKAYFVLCFNIVQ